MTPAQRKWPTAETEVARPVVAHLESQRWDVYQEVEGHGGRADIVAVLGSLVWVVEVKRTLSLSLLAQATAWRPWAHYVSIAVPQGTRANDGHRFGERLAEERGIGVIVVAAPVTLGRKEIRPAVVVPHVMGKLNRRASCVQELRNVLRPEHKTFAEAGGDTGRYWSPFRQTCKLVGEAVKSGARPLRDVISEIDHHYASDAGARACLTKWIDAGKIPGVTLRRDGRRLLVEVVP